MAKILLTGAAGFLGSHCLPKLKAAGHTVIQTDQSGNVDIVLNLADSQATKALPEADIVIHCAAVQYVTQKKPILHWKKFFYENNVEATRNLINRYNNKDVYFIHIGTSMQYEQNGADIYTTKSHMHAQGIYSQTKLIAQHIVDNSRLQNTTVIPCIIGGKGREGLFKGFVKTIQNQKLAIIPGKGIYPISIVHVEDVADLILQIVTHQPTGYFNAAAPDALSITQWAENIAQILGIRDTRFIHLPLAPLALTSYLVRYRLLAKEQLSMLSMPHVLDCENGKSIHWNAKYSSADIISDIVAHIRK